MGEIEVAAHKARKPMPGPKSTNRLVQHRPNQTPQSKQEAREEREEPNYLPDLSDLPVHLPGKFAPRIDTYFFTAATRQFRTRVSRVHSRESRAKHFSTP